MNACPHCQSPDLRPCSWQRPKQSRVRVAIGINENEDAVRQRVQCRTCRRYSALSVGETIPAHPGRPKVSRAACPCGSIDLRPCGWHADGRQHVRCNSCAKEFAMLAGILIAAKPTDKLGRAMRKCNTTGEREWEFPDPKTEAQELINWITARYGPYAPTELSKQRAELLVTPTERDFLYALARAGLPNAEFVEKAIAFRKEVAEHFDALLLETP